MDKREQMVFGKFGQQKIERTIMDAQYVFWETIHNEFVGYYEPDCSIGIDIDQVLIDAVVEYIWQNVVFDEEDEDE